MRPLMSCELPQCSHVLLGMDNYSRSGEFMISRTVLKMVVCAISISLCEIGQIRPQFIPDTSKERQPFVRCSFQRRRIVKAVM